MKWFVSSLVSMVVLAVAFTSCSDKAEPQPGSPSPPATEAPKTPLISKPQVADWCPEHGVPESVCTRCNDGLIAEFQAKNDWCKTHALPESQCLVCHPDLKAKFEAMAPKRGG